MRAIAVACAACVLAGCATTPRGDAPSVVRTRAPSDPRTAVSDYFDLMMAAPAQRRIAVGDPEPSDCALRGSGGRHQGWMVPVIYDTSPAATGRAGPKGDKGATAEKVADRRGAPGAARASAAGTAGPGGSSGAAGAASPSDGVASATLEEVKISGKGYFFWFSHDTIAAVSRRADSCPP